VWRMGPRSLTTRFKGQKGEGTGMPRNETAIEQKGHALSFAKQAQWKTVPWLCELDKEKIVVRKLKEEPHELQRELF